MNRNEQSTIFETECNLAQRMVISFACNELCGRASWQFQLACCCEVVEALFAVVENKDRVKIVVILDHQPDSVWYKLPKQF